MDNSNGEKSKRKPPSMWSVEAEELLMALWSQNAEKLRSCKKNGHILKKLTEKMAEMGYFYTDSEVRVKIHNLTSKYRRENKRVSEGLISTWPPYDSVHRILGANEPAMRKIEDKLEYTDDNISLNQTSSEVSDGDNYYEDLKLVVDDPDDDNLIENFDTVEFKGSKDSKTTWQSLLKDEIQMTMSDRRTNENLNNENNYLKSVNRNMELLIKHYKRSQMMERERSVILKQILKVLNNTHNVLENLNLSECRPRKNRKLWNTYGTEGEEEQYENFANSLLNDDPLDEDNPSEKDENHTLEDNIQIDRANKNMSRTKPNNTFKSLNMKIHEELLKTKELERQFMIEKHNLEMDILKIELEAKKKLNGL